MQTLYINAFVAAAALTFLIAAYAISNISIIDSDTVPSPSVAAFILLSVGMIGLTIIRRK